MDIQIEKIRIAKTILDTNNVELIQAVDVLLKKAENNEVIGSKTDGTPLTQSELADALANGRQEYKEGKYSTFDELVKKWDIKL